MKHSLLLIALLLSASFFTSCGSISNSLTEKAFTPQPKVKASETLAIAKAYSTHIWRPTHTNQFHSKDPTGIQVNTPDITMPTELAQRPGWWKPNKNNIGIPYKWGGFDTPLNFSQRLLEGAYAGDVYTDAKRQALYDGVSAYAAGVDCSGFVSRCWRLDRHYSTRDLPKLSKRLSSFSDLQPGDIINKHNVHVMLFAGFTDTTKQKFIAYQTGAPPSWKVQKYTLVTAEVQSWGFSPYRYKNIIQDL